ncbi:GNAT family N-acetyltransferase [Pedobacter immunditicola]|uniref:GNAT family N-acetyltransferase n=1 Tax=Pedobacter immunditicola TaxID=3133440 RepID=UPI0030995AEB
MMKRIYLISGLGADKRVFEKLTFDLDTQLIFLDWISTQKNESLEEYAARLALKIDQTSPFYLIGVSFGGFLATEIAKNLNPLHTFILSSTAVFSGIPWYYRLLGSFKLHQFIPTSFFKKANSISYHLFGIKTKRERNMLKNILIDTDPVFLKWALSSIVKWRNTVKPANLTHIHGTFDKILPIKYTTPDISISGGGHLMVFSMASQISAAIMKVNISLPPYDAFPTISGNKITLRQIQQSDIKDILEISYYDAVKASTIKQAIEMHDKINADYLQGNSIHWGIADLGSNQIVGTCGYYRGLDKGEGELGCVLLPSFRGQGLMMAAMQLAIGFGIKNIGLKRIWAVTTIDNHKARNMFDRLGFIVIKELPDGEIKYEFVSR